MSSKLNTATLAVINCQQKLCIANGELAAAKAAFSGATFKVLMEGEPNQALYDNVVTLAGSVKKAALEQANAEIDVLNAEIELALVRMEGCSSAKALEVTELLQMSTTTFADAIGRDAEKFDSEVELDAAIDKLAK